MERSLSVLLPARDIQSTLAMTVMEILEILPELTSRFELIIIDDGSQDATLEVADDLAALYPQVRALHHTQPQGHLAAVQTGLKHSSGDVIFLRDQSGELALDEVRKLWWAVEKHPLVLGRSEYGRWSGWKRRGAQESFRMVDRQAIQAIQKSIEEQAQLVASMIAETGPWFEVEVARRRAHRPFGQMVPRNKNRGKKTADRHGRQQPRSENSPIKKVAGPKYLRSLKDFAIGE